MTSKIARGKETVNVKTYEKTSWTIKEPPNSQEMCAYLNTVSRRPSTVVTGAQVLENIILQCIAFLNFLLYSLSKIYQNMLQTVPKPFLQ